MKKTKILIISIFLCFFLVNCQKEKINSLNSGISNSKEMTINRDDYRWIHERLFIETLSNIESNEYIDYNLLESQLMNVLQEGGIAPKDINNVNVKVIKYCETIVGFPKYPKDEFF